MDKEKASQLQSLIFNKDGRVHVTSENKNMQRRGYKGTSTSDHFLRPKFHLKAFRQLRDLTIFAGDALEHVHCAIHNLEKQSVVVVVDDDGGNDDVVNAANSNLPPCPPPPACGIHIECSLSRMLRASL